MRNGISLSALHLFLGISASSSEIGRFQENEPIRTTKLPL